MKFEYNEEKNQLLKETRGVSFEEVIEAIERGNLLDDIIHFNKKKYPNQKIYIVRIDKTIYAVPYIIDKEKRKNFLKTIYPNSKLKKIYHI